MAELEFGQKPPINETGSAPAFDLLRQSRFPINDDRREPMRQGQQNRRGRGRNNNNNNNNSSTHTSAPSNNRKPQNPLSRNYESSGPDVKIRGTAAQIAEKYITLARDAGSSGDSVMAENYLQHAEHYNRIIMAAQAQAATVSQPTNENNYAMNGAHHRHGPEANGALREQPQPQAQPQLQPHPQSAPQPTIPEPAPQQQPAADVQGFPDMPEFLQTPIREPKKEAAKEPVEGETDGRRRRRRYTATNGTSRTAAAAEGTAATGNGKAIEVQGEDRSSDEALI